MGCGMANHGHDVTMPARPGAQNTKPILGVVVVYSLDEARQHFLGRWFWLWTHADYPGPASRPLKTPKMCCVGISARASVGYLFATTAPCKSFGNRWRSAHKAWSSSKSIPVPPRLLDSFWTLNWLSCNKYSILLALPRGLEPLFSP